MDDSVDKMVRLQVRVQLFQLVMQAPMRITQTLSPVTGAANIVEAQCAICEAKKKIEDGQAPAYQSTLDFPHKYTCYFGNLIADLILATQEPL